ncbi:MULTISPECIES: GNAT family N-acetyltransferase [Croceitalea]|uniref:GNAT family protein n=1 Tax=Croceitalea vernalis TaxID=3075599 RepID=A0ABU3BG90_9FLAO|nr:MULTISPECIES: GNAT family protein [unclassified Croceitalea]MDT0539402.1 GNAT family protein [Croceitalea sp. P059]MDT0621195.1 GNAT family protein [Croceitalea sp. P007]
MSFDFKSNYILENKRVRLEPLQKNHFYKLKDIAHEEYIWTYFLGRSNGKKNFKGYVNEAVEFREKEKEYPFAIYDKITQRYAGSTRLFEISNEFNVARLGYTWYGKDFRGTGLNKNCKFLLFDFAFKQIQFERLGLGAHEENDVSLMAMKSATCSEEGRLRNLFPSIHKKGRSDAILFGILKEEWLTVKREILKNKL